MVGAYNAAAQMKRTLLCTTFVLVIAATLAADSNLRIDDVGLHGYFGIPTAVRLIVHNPSPQTQLIHLQVALGRQQGVITTNVAADISLSGGEQRQLELPILALGPEKRSSRPRRPPQMAPGSATTPIEGPCAKPI